MRRGARPAPEQRPAPARRRPSCRPSPGRRAGRRRGLSGVWESWPMTVSTWPSSSTRPPPVPGIRATRVRSARRRSSTASRSITASGGSSAAHSAIASSAPCQVTRWRGDGDQRLQLALGARGDPRRPTLGRSIGPTAGAVGRPSADSAGGSPASPGSSSEAGRSVRRRPGRASGSGRRSQLARAVQLASAATAVLVNWRPTSSTHSPSASSTVFGML